MRDAVDMTKSVFATFGCFITLALVILSTSAGAAHAAVTLQPTPRQPVFSELRVGSLQEPDSLNPHVGILSESYVIWAHVYELLVGIDRKRCVGKECRSRWSPYH